MRIGTIAYSTDTGLGYQTLQFCENMEPSKVLLVDLSEFNNLEQKDWRYEGLPKSVEVRPHKGMPDAESIEWLTEGVDLIFVCETPLNYALFATARDKGIKSVQQYNYEFLDYYRQKTLIKPDLLANPSYWMLDDTKSRNFAPVAYLPVPTFPQITPQERDSKHIGHIAGRLTAMDRNGTHTFLEFVNAHKKRSRGYKYTLFMQRPQENSSKREFRKVKNLLEYTVKISGLNVVYDVPNKEDLYKDIGILVLPRRYGGLCLPMWEALEHYIPVIMPDCSPNNELLPSNWLADCKVVGSVRTHSEIPLYRADIESLIEKVDNISRGYEDAREQASELVHRHSWEVMRPEYIKLFEKVINEEV